MYDAHHDSESIATTGAILRRGVVKAWAGALWMYKIVIPVSFLTFLLEVSHVLDHLEGILGPVMGLLHLPAKAAMPLLAGMLTGIYGGIAAMAVLSFTVKETTLIAVFLLISHALIQESVIQGQSGMHPLKATLSRLAVSAGVVWVIGWLWQGGGSAQLPAFTDNGRPGNLHGGTAELVLENPDAQCADSADSIGDHDGHCVDAGPSCHRTPGGRAPSGAQGHGAERPGGVAVADGHSVRDLVRWGRHCRRGPQGNVAGRRSGRACSFPLASITP